MTTQHERQELRAQAHALRMQARLMRQQAAQVRQEAAMTYTQVQLTALLGVMPGATATTRDITAEILGQRGLLGGPLRPRAPTVKAPPRVLTPPLFRKRR